MGSLSDREEILREHARHHFGVGGARGSGFIQALFVLCGVSDIFNLRKLRESFPQEVDAFIYVRDNS